jgi:hypothetical protein
MGLGLPLEKPDGPLCEVEFDGWMAECRYSMNGTVPVPHAQG